MPQNMKSANKFRTVLDLSVPFKPFQVPFMSTMRHAGRPRRDNLLTY